MAEHLGVSTDVFEKLISGELHFMTDGGSVYLVLKGDKLIRFYFAANDIDYPGVTWNLTHDTTDTSKWNFFET